MSYEYWKDGTPEEQQAKADKETTDNESEARQEAREILNEALTREDFNPLETLDEISSVWDGDIIDLI